MSVDVGSGTGEQEVPLIVPDFTCDGTVDFRSRPALRAHTGRWAACTFIGLIMLTLSASLTVLRPDTCTSASSCPGKPCLEAFGADQFDEGHPFERKSKSSFFNWWYFSIGAGSLLAFTVIVYIEDNASMGLGYGILAILITSVFCVFLVGTPLYRNRIPGGSSIVGIFQVFVAAARKWHVRVPHDHLLLYEVQDEESLQVGRKQLSHTSGFRSFPTLVGIHLGVPSVIGINC